MSTSRALRVTVLIVAASAAGCLDRRTPAVEEIADGRELPIIASTAETCSNIMRPLRLVLYGRAELSRLPLKLPEVDFDRQMVLLAAMGPSPSADCAIRIRRVWRDGARLRVQVEQSYPEASRRRQAGVASPFHAIVVPRSTLPIERFSSIIPAGAVSDDGPRRS